MVINSNQPQKYDAVLGAGNRTPDDGLILGGLEGVKHRLAHKNADVRVSALSEALKYGEAGLTLIIEALDHNLETKVRSRAYLLLQDQIQIILRTRLNNWFEFETIIVNNEGIIISKKQRQAKYYREYLDDYVTLDLVYIPGGSFMMGSPSGEGYTLEKPQHEVKLEPFYMGKYPVTQGEWRFVSTLPKVHQALKGKPSYFKGDNRPVEQVSFYDAVEFCERLSRNQNVNYRLPSEAEWEYACRAGTTTSYYCGETITKDLANCNLDKKVSAQVSRYNATGKLKKTTAVGKFSPNQFGLYDMYGNVMEWCADTWHENYKNAPTNGTAWITGGNERYSPVRGGSWRGVPPDYRSAFREDFYGIREYFSWEKGFRIVCSAEQID